MQKIENTNESEVLLELKLKVLVSQRASKFIVPTNKALAAKRVKVR